jgi:hypothetical protein
MSWPEIFMQTNRLKRSVQPASAISRGGVRIGRLFRVSAADTCGLVDHSG